MNRYLLFAGQAYYSAGGLNEYIARFETIESASVIGDKLMRDELGYYSCDWYQVVDSLNMKDVVKAGNQLYNSTTLDDIRGLGEELAIKMFDSDRLELVKAIYQEIVGVIANNENKSID